MVGECGGTPFIGGDAGMGACAGGNLAGPVWRDFPINPPPPGGMPESSDQENGVMGVNGMGWEVGSEAGG